MSNVSAVTSEISLCTFKECSLNYPRWLSTVKGFPNAVIMAHSNSIYQQAEAITASMDFDYWLYALMTSNLSATRYFTQLEGRKPPFLAMYSLLLLPFHLLGRMSPVELKLCNNGLHRVMWLLLMDEGSVHLCPASLIWKPSYHCISSPEEYKESQVRLDIICLPWAPDCEIETVWQETHKECNVVPCQSFLDWPLQFTSNEYWPCYFGYWCKENTSTMQKVIMGEKPWADHAQH